MIRNSNSEIDLSNCIGYVLRICTPSDPEKFDRLKYFIFNLRIIMYLQIVNLSRFPHILDVINSKERAHHLRNIYTNKN